MLSDFLKSNYYVQKRNVNLRDSQINSVISQSSNNPTQACSFYFRLVYGRSLYRKIVHPLQWSRFAIKIEGLSKKESYSITQTKGKEP